LGNVDDLRALFCPNRLFHSRLISHGHSQAIAEPGRTCGGFRSFFVHISRSLGGRAQNRLPSVFCSERINRRVYCGDTRHSICGIAPAEVWRPRTCTDERDGAVMTPQTPVCCSNEAFARSEEHTSELQ